MALILPSPPEIIMLYSLSRSSLRVMPTVRSSKSLLQTLPSTSKNREQISPTEVDIIFSATIDKGWHVYSTGLPSDGPTSAVLHTEKAEGAKAAGKLKHQGKEINVYDNIFDMKLRFFTNVSHELRTPLSLIVSPIENILDTIPKTDPNHSQMELIYRNSQKLLRMVNQLLDFRKTDI